MRRLIQYEIAARHTRAFSRDAGLRNRLAVEMQRAQHERRRSPLATRYRGAPVVAAIVAAVAALAASGAGAGTTAKANWHVLPGVKLSEGNPAPVLLGSSSGRVWAGFLERSDRPLTVVSARPDGGGLKSFASAALQADPSVLADQELFVHTRPSGELSSVRLLASGRLGAPAAVPENPEARPPQSYHPGVVAATRVGDRTVWVLAGVEETEGPTGGFSTKVGLWLCCSEADTHVDITRFLKGGKDAHSFRLGTDGKGRLWLAWSNPVRMVEIDPATLAPRSQLFAVQGSPDKFAFTCATVCRVVGSEWDRIHAWSPGERQWTTTFRSTKAIVVYKRGVPTKLLDQNAFPNLLAAEYRSGDLTTAYVTNGDGRTATLTVLRGDARGLRAGVVSSIEVPSTINARSANGYLLLRGVYATFVPGGLVALATYAGAGGRRAQATLVPLAR
jgi:hypothetical protein